MNEQQQQKPPCRFSQTKYHRWEFLLSWLLIKKMITEVFLVLPLYLILFFIWWRFRHLIKAMADVGNILNDDAFFGDIVDTPKEGIEQHEKREYLKSVTDRGKAYLLGHKWTQEKVDKASNKIVNKTYAECKQRELNEKGEKTAKSLGNHVIDLYSNGISQCFKIKDVKKSHQDIEGDPLMKDQVVNLGCFSVYTLGNYLAPVLIVAHTLNNLDRGNRQNHKNKGCEIDKKELSLCTL